MFIFKILITSIAIYFVIALALILSQWPNKALTSQDTLDFDSVVDGDDPQDWPVEQITLKDGTRLDARQFMGEGDARPLIVLVHGSGWYGQQFDRMIPILGEVADVIAPDLRGHGPNAVNRGDVDYIGQLEDDLAEIIETTRKPGQKVAMLGHSSGGGLVVRFAGGAHGHMLDHAFLIAPFLKYNAPTTRENSGGWAHVLLRRVIGLSMLNTVKITALNHLTMIQFAMPEQVLNGPYGAGATTAYSYRLNTSYAPRGDYLADIAALPQFDLIVGDQDEAFIAKEYETLMSSVTEKGEYHILTGLGHLDVVQAAPTIDLIKARLNAF